jgi:hypothetical protein
MFVATGRARQIHFTARLPGSLLRPRPPTHNSHTRNIEIVNFTKRVIIPLNLT